MYYISTILFSRTDSFKDQINGLQLEYIFIKFVQQKIFFTQMR